MCLPGPLCPTLLRTLDEGSMTFYTLRAATTSRLYYSVERVTLRAVFGFEEICTLFDALIAACVLRLVGAAKVASAWTFCLFWA